MFTGALLSMALAGASFAPKASAAPAITTTIINNIPFNNITLLNPCTGQPVTLSGVLHVTYHETVLANDIVNIVQNLDFSNVKGTDLFGNSYVAHEAVNKGLHVSINGAAVVTYPDSFVMVSTGSAPNWRVHALIHVTINADFSITSSIYSFTETCGP
jgi:hypothetical protein